MKFKIGVAFSLITASVLMGELYELGKIEVTSQKDINQNPSVDVVFAESLGSLENLFLKEM